MFIKKENLLIFLTVLMMAVSCFIGVSEGTENQTNEEVKMVTEGNLVKVSYTLTVDGNVIDSTQEGKPFEFQVGNKQVIPGFEEAIIGMKAGEKKSFEVSPDKGYGHENPQGIQEVPKDKLPPDVKPEVGMMLHGKRPDGQTFQARITEVKEDIITVNLNHPLAGKTLNFEVDLIEIN
jgi:FKBP-type peptidyl-prolyl cis-trans isomerase 2